jgi:hypothetical protein
MRTPCVCPLLVVVEMVELGSSEPACWRWCSPCWSAAESGQRETAPSSNDSWCGSRTLRSERACEGVTQASTPSVQCCRTPGVTLDLLSAEPPKMPSP